MSTQTSFDLTGLSRAIRGRDCRYHLALYAPDAVVEIFDWAQPDAPVQVLRGKPAIGEWLDGMSSDAVHYEMRDAVAHPDRVTYTEECRYGDGSKVLFECSAQVSRGQITRATVTLVNVPRRQGPSRPVRGATSRTTERRSRSRPPHQASRRRETSRQLPGQFLG